MSLLYVPPQKHRKKHQKNITDLQNQQLPDWLSTHSTYQNDSLADNQVTQDTPTDPDESLEGLRGMYRIFVRRFLPSSLTKSVTLTFAHIPEIKTSSVLFRWLNLCLNSVTCYQVPYHLALNRATPSSSEETFTVTVLCVWDCVHWVYG